LAPGELLYDADATGSFQIYVAAASGPARQLTRDASTDAWWPRPSPERTRILFYRTPAGTHDRDFTRTSLWVMNADGTAPTELLPPGSYGWNQHGHAEWSPDGQHLVMFGGKVTNPQIWVTDKLGRQPRQLTHDGGVNIDPSWSPDGRTIVYVGCPHAICTPSQQEIYVMGADGGQRLRLTDDGVRDHDPYYSPNGKEIAFLSQTARPTDSRVAGSWNIRSIDAAGGAVRDITTGTDVTSLPRWSPDGRLFTHRLIYGRPGFDLWELDPRTGQGHVVREAPYNEEYPSP
jgi:Tol biopolymer transport system component